MLSRQVRLLLLTILGSVVLAAPASASELQINEDYTPFNESHTDYFVSVQPHHRFVTVGTSGGRPALLLTATTKKRYAGRRLAWECNAVDDGQELLSSPRSEGGDAVIGRKAAPVRVSRAIDYCLIQVTVRRVRKKRMLTTTERLRQTVATTDAGRTYVDRVYGAAWLSVGSVLAGVAYFDSGKAFPTADKILAKYPTFPGIVALERPDAPAPLGKIGLWTDGAQRIRVTYGLIDGTQLFAEYDKASKVFTTNADAELHEVGREDSWWWDSTSESERTSQTH